MRAWWAIGLVACGGADEDPSGGTGSGTGTGTETNEGTSSPTTGTTGTGAVSGAACVVADNALRFDCSAAAADAEGSWTFDDGAGWVRTFDTSGPDHAVTAWGLRAGTYQWTFTTPSGGASGTVATGALPTELAPFDAGVEGQSSAFDAVFFLQTCGTTNYLLLADPSGALLWYEAVGTNGPGGGVVGYQWTDRDTILYGVGQTQIVERTPAGEVLWTADGFERPLHHDLYRGGDYVYALNAADHAGTVVDGLYVLRDGAVVAEWDLADHVAVGGDGVSDPFWQQWFPGSDDWSHGNSVWSDGARVLLSLRWQDAVLEIGGDPTAPDFGAIRWVVTGTAASDLDSDYRFTAGSFDGQHCAIPTADGFAVFDNRAMNLDSRAVLFAMDDAAGTITEVASWSVGEHCDIQGGAYPLADGGMLATCATGGRVMAFAADAADAAWQMAPTCGDAAGGGGPGGGPPTLARGIPVSLR